MHYHAFVTDEISLWKIRIRYTFGTFFLSYGIKSVKIMIGGSFFTSVVEGEVNMRRPTPGVRLLRRLFEGNLVRVLHRLGVLVRWFPPREVVAAVLPVPEVTKEKKVAEG